MNKLPSRIIPLALVLASCGGKAIRTYDLGTPASQQAEAYIEAERPKAARDAKRIVIPYFQVEFVQQSSASANVMGQKAGAGLGSSSSRVKTTVTLSGVAPTQFQAITNDFYDAVVADLKGAGVDVVSLDQMRASPEFKTLSGHGCKDSPDTIEHFDNISKFYAPHGMQVYYLPKDERFSGAATGKKSGPSIIGAFSQMGAGISGVYGGGAYKFVDEEVALAKALGAKVLRVRVVIDFADVSAEGHSGAQGGTTSSHSAVRISFPAKDTFFQFNGSDGEGGFSLKIPLVSGDGFAEKKDGGYNSGGGKNWEAAANGTAYEASVRKHLEAFRGLVMARLKSSL